MPEGPEVRREADKISSALTGKVIKKIWAEYPELKKNIALFRGKRVKNVFSMGKALLIEFPGSKYIYSHNQLYGKWFVLPAGESLQTNRQLRLSLITSDHQALLYSASMIELLDREQFKNHTYLANLGLNVLDSEVSEKAVVKRLKESRFSRRQLSSLYLDQKFLAGIGNYLRSEILFFAGLRGDKIPKNLDDKTIRKLAKHSLTVARRSYKSNGSTLTARLRKSRKAKSRFSVFARAGKECLLCNTKIKKIYVNSRRLYFCPTCQT